MARNKLDEAVPDANGVRHVSMTVEELTAFVEERVNAATGRRSDGQTVEAKLALHRQDHTHGPLVAALLAIAAHNGLHYDPTGSSPFDRAIQLLLGE